MTGVMVQFVKETIASGEFESLFERLPGFRRLVQVAAPWASEILQPVLKRWLLSGAPARKALTARFLLARHDAWSDAVLAEAIRCDDATVRMAVVRSLAGGRPTSSV